MRRFLHMLAVALCFGAMGANADDSLTKADFAHSIKLSVDGYTGSETLVNFPVLVRVSEGSIDGFRYDEMSATNKNGVALGFDLAFFAEDGTRLASTNDTWNASGESLAWVRLPSMTQGTKFYMCYNVADGVVVDNPNPFTDYTGVWHMNDEGGKNKPISDSSTNELNGVTASTGNPSSVSVGKVGKARHIATDKNNNPPKDSGITISLPEGSAKRRVVDDLDSEFTASMWVRVTDDFNYFYLFSRKYKDAYPAWGFQTKNDTSGTLRMWTGADGETENNVAMPVLDVALAAKNEWHKLDVIYKSDGTYEIYQDGGNKVSGALYNNTPALQGSLAGLSIGGGFASSEKVKGCRGLNGDMDEVRLRKGVLSADWVKADYDTVNDPNFVGVALSDSLAIAWVDSVAGAQGVEGTTYNSVVFAGTVQDLGAAGACAIKYKVWAEGASEPGVWTTLTNGLAAADTFAVAVRGLEGSTTYNYRIRASSDEGAGVPISGTFMTDNGLSVDWSAASGVTGFSHIAYDFAVVGGTIKGLGAASSCIVQAKVWEVGEDEPSVWKTLTGNLASRDSFTGNVTGLDAGTTYNYMLRVLGTDDSEAGAVAGTFTTLGEAGETIGTPGETFFFNDGTNAYWVAEEFERYLPFTVTGYKGTETLTNFPVLVDIRARDENGFSYDDFYHVGGKDIVFVDERGHIIPHEIDTWNANGQSLIWVRLPEMNNGTTFTMCYRSPLVNPPSDPGNVFERYVGVWHMNEKGDGVVDVIDSTTNNLTGETHAQSLAYSSGRIGGARRVAQQAGTSSSLGRIIVFDKNDILRTGVGNVFTYSCWSKLADSHPGWAYIVSRKREDADKGWGIQYETGDLESTLRAWGGSTAKNKAMQFAVTGYHHEEWAYWTFVYSNDTFRAYLYGDILPDTKNGKKIARDGQTYPVANDETASYDNLVIGGQQVGTGAFNGWVDECRYSKGMRSADWIKAEYDSTMQQAYWNDPDRRFVTKGDQVGRGPESLVPVVVWEQGEGLPNTIIDVSYAYVQFAGTVTFCGSGANTCFIEYQLWADGEVVPTEWTVLLDNAIPGDVFSIPVCGLKQDMPYNFRIRAVNEVDGVRRMTHEHAGSFRTNGNVNEAGDDGDLLRVDNRFVHRYPAGEYTFTTPDYVTNVEILVVGGGGAGGYRIGGGGGGGGVFHSLSYPVTTSTTYRVTVGRGGEAVTNATTASSEGNGEYSFFALDSDPSHPLIEVPGGGGGGSFGTAVVDDKCVAVGGDGASGGGGGGFGTEATTGASGGSAIEGFGHNGGNGNHFQANTSGSGAYAGGGGGGGGRAGVDASSDSWYGGGAGGVGVGCDVLGEMLYFGAGGGGGYAYRTGKDSEFSKPGAGGSGIGGDAADVRNKTLATSGVPNTGAGGGGGSMTRIDNTSDMTYWQGGHGGDGVVIIAYEVHGRDPIAEEPRISMTRCEYDKDAVKASIDYRLYWAGMQNDFDDIYVHYSTVGPEELTNSAAGGWVKVAESALGLGTVEFTPPEVGHTYWVRIVARKNAGSFYYSDEFASFDVPAITLRGAIWTESETSPDEDYATVTYKLYDTSEASHLYCYWSENRSALETDEPPIGEGVFLMDLGANTESNLSSSTTFRIPATEGLIRNRTYYIRLAAGDGQGMKFFPSHEIVELDTAEKPISILAGASWADSNVATVEFTATVGKLDPAQTELVAFYSIVENDVKGDAPEANGTVTMVGLGFCSDLALDAAQSSASFPLWSATITNYYVRLALATNYVSVADGVATTNRVVLEGSHSPGIATISVSHAVEANTLLYIVTANPKIMCYGDDPLALDYVLEYAGLTEGWGWDNKYDLNGGSLACGLTSATPSGNYAIEQGTLALVNGGDEKKNTDESTGVETFYQYKLTFSGATYIITNAVFKASISDVVTNYTGDAYDPSGLQKTFSNVRNNQPVTYRYRVGGAGEWGELPAFTNVGNYAVQFIASAPSHDDVRGTFKVTVAPAPLSATIGDVELDYTGDDMTPDVVTNVTGLVRSDINPLACEFRDESGEWQSTVPQFKSPGTYKLFFRVSAPNHESYTTNCTITVKGWDYKVNMDGMTGYATPINVSDPGWLIHNSVHTGAELADPGTRYADLDKVCGNGLKYWQNYVIGRTNLNQKLIATIMQSDKRVRENCFIVRFSAVQALRNTGLDVKFRLDTKLRGESEFTLGELSEKYEMNVPLGPGDPTGLYVFNVVLTPTNSAYTGCSVLTSVTTVGVIRVMSPVRNTVTAVPWGSITFGTETNAAVMVANVLNPNGLTADDQLLAYDVETHSFRSWKHVSGNDWDSIASVTKGGVFESSANETRFNQGEAFWLSRSNPIKEDGSPVPYYLIGRYTGRDYLVDIAEGAANAPASSVCANPTMFDIDLNALVFEDNSGNPATPSFDDRIVTQTTNGTQAIYFRSKVSGKWGRNVIQKVNGRNKNVFVEGGNIPSGTGFWFQRKAEGKLRIRFESPERQME